MIAVDLPGSGFSDRSTMEVAVRSDGSLQRLRDIYGLIQEKGIFWAFDQIVETGQIPYEEIMKSRVLERKSVKSIELGSEELGRVLGQVIQTMNLAPVHLVESGFLGLKMMMMGFVKLIFNFPKILRNKKELLH